MQDFVFNPVAYLGTEHRATNTEIILGLESMKYEIKNKGMSREMYHKVENIYPGTLKNYGIDPRRLTTNGSANGQAVACEAIDVAAALQGGTAILGTTGMAVAGVGLAAGIGYLMYRFYKWAKEFFGKSDRPPSDDPKNTSDAASANYASKKTNAKPPVDENLAALYKTYVDDPKAKPELTGVVLTAIHHCEHGNPKLGENAAKQICERALDYVDKSNDDNAVVVMDYVLSHKDGVHPVWALLGILPVAEFTEYEKYIRTITKLVPLVTTEFGSGGVDERVKELKDIFTTELKYSDLTMPTQDQNGIMALIKKLTRAIFNSSPSLNAIIDEASVSPDANGATKATEATMASYKNTKYSIWHGIGGIDTQILLLTQDNFNKMADLSRSTGSGAQYRDALKKTITTLNGIMVETTSKLEGNELTEDKIKSMAKTTSTDNTAGQEYSALSQAVFKHVGYALRLKKNIDDVSAGIKEMTETYKAFID